MSNVLHLIALLLLLAPAHPEPVAIPVPDGTLYIQPLAEDAVRVQVVPPGARALEELIFTEIVQPPKYRVRRHKGNVTVRTRRMRVEYDASTFHLRFLDARGNVLLQEKERFVIQQRPDPGAFTAQVSFDAPEGEHLYGTGQFQDGYLDIRGLTRRLTQVNTQISLPMILSSRGYGLLWHNYGLTDFNPARDSLLMAPNDYDAGEGVTVDATGTAGNRREQRFFQRFSGDIDIPADGEYALLLDMGREMARRQYLTIDGQPVIDISNTWLPPTAAVKVRLQAGRHRLEAEGTRGDLTK